MRLDQKECPVCGGKIAHSIDRDYGDKKLIDCMRCGFYEISKTALTMLGRRLEEDKLAGARLSHSIRLATSRDNPLLVVSTNLEEFIKIPLPGIEEQTSSLLKMIASRLGDDQLGFINLDVENVASIIGAVDGKSVARLVALTVQEGLLERDGQDLIGLTTRGWQKLKNTVEKHISVPNINIKEEKTDFETAHCNKCGPNRNAYKRAIYKKSGTDDDGSSFSDTYIILECCGCGEVCVQHLKWFSEWDNIDQDPLTGQPRYNPGIEVSYWPAPLRREEPKWVPSIKDENLRQVIGEVYKALNSGLVVLAAIGCRTLLDRAMYLNIGDLNTFAKKLDKMVENGHIGINERSILEAITDAGSAAAHRGFAPSAENLETIVTTIEILLHREFILKKAADQVRAETPPRKNISPPK